MSSLVSFKKAKTDPLSWRWPVSLHFGLRPLNLSLQLCWNNCMCKRQRH